MVNCTHEGKKTKTNVLYVNTFAEKCVLPVPCFQHGLTTLLALTAGRGQEVSVMEGSFDAHM